MLRIHDIFMIAAELANLLHHDHMFGTDVAPYQMMECLTNWKAVNNGFLGKAQAFVADQQQDAGELHAAQISNTIQQGSDC